MKVNDNRHLHAVIIAIENYRFGITPVEYARNDALALQDMLITEFGLKTENITLWLDEQATKSALEEELPYFIRQLTNEDSFYFYYAGHGFSQNRHNRITAWDTHPGNLSDTTVFLRDILLEPLQKSPCNKSLIFMDACASDLFEINKSRDLLADMSDREFDEFIRPSAFQATYLSCSPGEKSYPSSSLKHGIWTWHLLQALKGEAADAIVRDYYITSSSLRDYLSKAVSEYITQNTSIRGTQTPMAHVSAPTTFEIRKLAERNTDLDVFKDVKINFQEAFLRRLTTESISRLAGFDKRKRHFVPGKLDSAANSFVQGLLEDEIAAEIDTVYNNTKNIFSLKRKDIVKKSGLEGGSVDTSFFRFNIDPEQNPDDCTEALITRTLLIRGDYKKLPTNFDKIFPIQLNEIVIPMSGALNFDDLVDKFENFRDVDGGDLREDDRAGLIQYTTPDDLTISISTTSGEIAIYSSTRRGCRQMIDDARMGIVRIQQANKELLE